MTANSGSIDMTALTLAGDLSGQRDILRILLGGQPPENGVEDVGTNLLTPDQEAELVLGLVELASQGTAMQLANLRAQRARLDQAEEAILARQEKAVELLAAAGNGHDKNSAPVVRRSVIAPPAMVNTSSSNGKQTKAKILLTLLDGAGNEGMMVLDLKEACFSHKIFNEGGLDWNIHSRRVTSCLGSLSKQGFVKPVDRGLWCITDAGRKRLLPPKSVKPLPTGLGNNSDSNVGDQIPVFRGLRGTNKKDRFLDLLALHGNKGAKVANLVDTYLKDPILNDTGRDTREAVKKRMSVMLNELKRKGVVERISCGVWRAVSNGDGQTGSSHRKVVKVGSVCPPRRCMPNAPPSSSSAKLRVLSPADTAEWQKLLLFLLEQLKGTATFEDVMAIAKSHAPLAGYRISEVSDTVIQNGLSQAYTALKSKGKIGTDQNGVFYQPDWQELLLFILESTQWTVTFEEVQEIVREKAKETRFDLSDLPDRIIATCLEEAYNFLVQNRKIKKSAKDVLCLLDTKEPAPDDLDPDALFVEDDEEDDDLASSLGLSSGRSFEDSVEPLFEASLEEKKPIESNADWEQAVLEAFRRCQRHSRWYVGYEQIVDFIATGDRSSWEFPSGDEAASEMEISDAIGRLVDEGQLTPDNDGEKWIISS